MAGKDIEATPEQIKLALNSVTGQAIAHGLDVKEPQLEAFLQLTAEIQAQQHAEILMTYNLINRIPPKVFAEYPAEEA